MPDLAQLARAGRGGAEQHLCSSVYVLADGKVVGHDTIANLVTKDLLSDAYLG